MHIIWTILIGFIVGLLAKMLAPGRDPSGFFLTVAIGIAGSLLATCEPLLDKLVAVQMDVAEWHGKAQVVASLESIADACDVLRSAIADVRSIIHRADGWIWICLSRNHIRLARSVVPRSVACASPSEWLTLD